MEVSQEASMDLENQLKKARTNLRIHKRAYFSARAEAKDSDPAEKLLVVHIAKANAQEALEEVHDLEKRLGITPMTEESELNDEDPKPTTAARVVQHEADEVAKRVVNKAVDKDVDMAELERWKSGDIVEMDEKTLRAYRSKRATIKDLNELFERGYRLQMGGSTSAKATPNVKNFSDLMIKVKRMFADATNLQFEDIVQSFEALYGVEFSWHNIRDNQLAECQPCFEYVERVSEDVAVSSTECGVEEVHDRLPQSSKLLLRIRNPNKVFEDHLSIRNSLVGKGVGVFAERIFYKGAVVSLYLGQPVWSSNTVGGNIPERTHVVDHMRRDGGPLEAISVDYLVPIRDFYGRYYVVCNSNEIPKNKGTHVDRRKGNVTDNADLQEEEEGLQAGGRQAAGVCRSLSCLYFGAHFIEFEEGGDANAELLEDGSVVALRQIDQNTEIILRRNALRSEEEVKEEVAKAANASESSEDESDMETIRPVVRATKARVKVESRPADVWGTGRSGVGLRAVSRQCGVRGRTLRARPTKSSATVQQFINQFSQDATESQWKEFLELYGCSDDGPDPVANAKCLAVVARRIHPGTVEYEESGEEPDEEDTGDNPKVATKKRKVMSSGRKVRDEDANEDGVSAPRTMAKRKNAPPKPSPKRRKESQKPPHVRWFDGAASDERVAASASVPSSSYVRRGTKSRQTAAATFKRIVNMKS